MYGSRNFNLIVVQNAYYYVDGKGFQHVKEQNIISSWMCNRLKLKTRNKNVRTQFNQARNRTFTSNMKPKNKQCK